MHSTQRSEPTDLSVVRIRRARATDLESLIALEQQCFDADFQESVSSMRHSLKSPHQEVWIAERDKTLVGAMFLRLYRHSLRIYSVAVARTEQGKGLGGALMGKALQRAQKLGMSRLLLEANAEEAALVRWYAGLGFRKVRRLAGYYSGKADAWKMVCPLYVAN